jgi:hypothetical protein
MKRLSLLMVSLAAASLAMATTYVRVEKDGSKTYSDRPLPGGQPVELEPVQTYSAPQNTRASSSSNLPADQRALQDIDDFKYDSCSLSPANDETIPNPEMVSVTVSLEPALRAGDKVNLVVDGKAAEPYQTSMILQPVERGAHTASVTLKDNYGRTLCSASVTFNVMQPSVARPRRR